jgi:hypothetical protein
MPRVHAAGVALEAARFSARGGHDEELAVGLQQHETPRLAEDNPSSVRRELREEIAFAIFRGAGNRFGGSATAFVEGDAIEVELQDLAVLQELVAFLRGEEGLALGIAVLELIGLGASEHELPAIGAPDGIALHVLGIIGPGQRPEGLVAAPIIDQDALDGEKKLRKLEVGRRDENRFVFHRANNELSVGRHLREQPERLDAVFAFVGTPGDDIAGGQRHLFIHSRGDVRAFVVGIINVHPHRRGVLREGVAVAADRQPLQDHGRGLRRIHAPKPPADF